VKERQFPMTLHRRDAAEIEPDRDRLGLDDRRRQPDDVRETVHN
jgi:hypothetical protein